MVENFYAVSVLLRDDSVAGRLTFSHTLHHVKATSVEEATGKAIVWAMEAKPGFSVSGVIHLQTNKS